MENVIYTRAEAAAFIGVSAGTLAVWRHKGIGPESWLNGQGRVVYPLTGLQTWLDERARNSKVGGTS